MVVAHSDDTIPVAHVVLVPTFTNNTSPVARNTIYSSTTTTVNNNGIVAAGPTATTSKVQVLLIDTNIVSYNKPSKLGFFWRNTTKTYVECKFLLCVSWGATLTSRAHSLRWQNPPLPVLPGHSKLQNSGPLPLSLHLHRTDRTFGTTLSLWSVAEQLWGCGRQSFNLHCR